MNESSTEAALKVAIAALERLAFRSNTLGQKRQIAREALDEIETLRGH